MKLKPEQLTQHLKSTLLPLYWLQGDEPLLVRENSDLLRQHILAQGYAREIFYGETSSDWAFLKNSAQHLSLFSEKKLLELRLTSTKLNEAQRKALQDYLSELPSHCILLIISPKLPSQTWQASWFQKLEKIAGVITVWPIEASHLPGWIQQRMKKNGLLIDFTAAQYLAEAFEGNLLAATQMIEKLTLTPLTKKNISLQELEPYIAGEAKFDIFKLVDTSLTGNFSKAYRMLKNLEAEGIEPTLILWAFTRELRVLAHMLERKNQGIAIQTIMNEFRIFTLRKSIMQQALQSISFDKIYRALHYAAKIDACIKGLEVESEWIYFTQLIQSLSSIKQIQG